MIPAGPGVSLPPLRVPARIPSSSAALPSLPPIASAPLPPLRVGGPAQPQRHSRPGVPGGDKDAGRLPAVTRQGDTPLGARKPTSPAVTLTDSLITARSLPRLVEPPHPESRSTGLLSPSSTVPLDRENIGAIRRLQNLREIRSLYLQQNKIKKMENLGCFPNLRFLSLAGNHICRVENLLPLRHLRGLDLSHNQVQALDPDELPRSLQRLDLRGNECTHQHGYRELVVGALPHLLELDAQNICSSLGEEEEAENSPSSEDEDAELLSELSGPFTTGRDFFVDLHQELTRRSRWRRREALDDHQTRLEELEELQERQDLLLPPAPLSPGREGAACLMVPDPSRPHPHPQTKPGLQLPPLPGPGEQPQRAPGRSQPQSKALEKTRTKGARNRRFPQTPQARTAPHSSD